MEIKIRNVSKYKDVSVEIDSNLICGSSLELGLHNLRESRHLSRELIHASEELLGDLPEDVERAYRIIFDYLEESC